MSLSGPLLGDIFVGCEDGSVHLWSTRQCRARGSFFNQGAVTALGWVGPADRLSVVSSHETGDVWISTGDGTRKQVRMRGFRKNTNLKTNWIKQLFLCEHPPFAWRARRGLNIYYFFVYKKLKLFGEKLEFLVR